MTTTDFTKRVFLQSPFCGMNVLHKLRFVQRVYMACPKFLQIVYFGLCFRRAGAARPSRAGAELPAKGAGRGEGSFYQSEVLPPPSKPPPPLLLELEEESQLELLPPASYELLESEELEEESHELELELELELESHELDELESEEEDDSER